MLTPLLERLLLDDGQAGATGGGRGDGEEVALVGLLLRLGRDELLLADHRMRDEQRLSLASTFETV